MYKLSLPQYDLSVKKMQNKQYVFDVLRKKYVRLTPEEWVRQQMIHFLIHEKKYPKSLMNSEVGLELYSLPKRADILSYTSQGNPLLLVECKSPNVRINQNVFEQIANYNIVIKAPFLIVTNGITIFACEIDFYTKSYTFLQEIPEYKNI
ncbi:MAG: type I restriction enzyme HsdR N-terminal domain-containing protein [Bacteroidales bacterium]|jgi:type I site-specific restriction endonuclease|nr:type I restriction enzyme HsdR N-terminal domain-containing protein [Bacteroidales bacterium]